MSTPNLAKAITLIDKAQTMTRAMRGRIARAHLLDFAEEQLLYMRRILEEGRAPTDEEKGQIGVGRMAIQEFEGGSFNDYAVTLEEADGAFCLL